MNKVRIIDAFRLFRQGYRGYKKQIIVLASLGFVSGILEGVGVNAIIPLFSFISDTTVEGTGFISRSIEWFFSALHIPYSLSTILIFIVVLFLIKAAALLWFNYINVIITTDYEQKTREELFRATMEASWPYLLKQKIGYLDQVLITDVTRGTALLRHLTGLILLGTNVLVYAVIALNISFLITTLTLVIGLVLFYIFKPMFYKARVIAREQAEINKEVSHLTSEHMLGAKIVKSSGKESFVIERARHYFERLRETSVRVNFLSSLNNNLVEPVGIIFIVVVFAISYRLPEFSFASFAVIIYLIQKIFSYTQVTQSRVQTISEFIPYLSIIIQYRDEAEKNHEKNTGTKPFLLKKELFFKDISFSYSPDRPAIDKISFSIKTGEMIGLIGPSGAGKTTLVDLILRLFKPGAGLILVDGVSADEISLESWRKKISYVSQEVFLLNDTVANNIRFYNPKLTDKEIMEAAKIANIYDFIMQLPNKMDTVVGERGVLLSGGQRQRVILARAIAAKPELLILDEATSALDNESELLIQKAIENLKGKITVLAIAHRLSTIINSDRLLILEKGRITQEGSPKTLLIDKKSYFNKVYNIRKIQK